MGFQRLDFGPGWQATNDNLIELVDVLEGDRISWMPRAGEWPAVEIFAHIIGARYHGPIASRADTTQLKAMWGTFKSHDGIKEGLRASWDMIARFLCDADKLDAVYEVSTGDSSSRETPPPLLGSVERAAAGMDLGYVDNPETYSGHYIAYHRFAHDLHHRSTLIGYLGQLGVSLDGRRIRPL